MKIGQFIDHAVSSVQCDPLIWILISPVAKVVELAASIIIMHIYLGGYNYHNGVRFFVIIINVWLGHS